jgi:hypothetical protein
MQSANIVDIGMRKMGRIEAHQLGRLVSDIEHLGYEASHFAGINLRE